MPDRQAQLWMLRGDVLLNSQDWETSDGAVVSAMNSLAIAATVDAILFDLA